MSLGNKSSGGAHTPGPWAFFNETLCQAHGKYVHLGEWRESPGLGHAANANARLIEAAPELLAALQAVVRDWTAQFERHGSMAPAWCQQARNAIATATKETQ